MGTKHTGYIGETREDGFVVMDPKTGSPMFVTYTNVSQVTGHNISNKAKIAIKLGFIAAIVVLIIIVAANVD